MFYGHAIGYKPCAICSSLRTRDEARGRLQIGLGWAVRIGKGFLGRDGSIRMHRLNYNPVEDNLANMIEALDMFVGAQGAVATAHMPWLACPTISKARAKETRKTRWSRKARPISSL